VGSREFKSHVLFFPIAAVPYTRVSTSKFGFKFIPKKEKIYRNYLVSLAKSQWNKQCLIGALRVEVLFSFNKAKTSKLIQHTKRPDLSNLIKSIEDAFNGIIWKDDSQIIEIHARKIFGPADCITLQISEVKEDD